MRWAPDRARRGHWHARRLNSSSQPTHPWREMTSNHRSLSRGSRFILRKVNCAGIDGRPKKFGEVPMVRIHLPPAASLRTIGPSPEEDAKIAQEHPAKLSAATVRPGRRRPRSALTSPACAHNTERPPNALSNDTIGLVPPLPRGSATDSLTGDLQLQRCNRKPHGPRGAGSDGRNPAGDYPR